MARGVVPRQPARTGRQDKVRVKNAHVGTGAFARQGQGKASAAAPKGRQGTAGKSTPTSAPKIKGYNPVAPDRVTEILKRLDQLYTEVKCALTHASAWELVVATILSA